MKIKRMWVNQPSGLQLHHDLHRLENTYKLLDKMYLPQRETVLHRGQTWWCTFKNSEPKG